jgi:hypothetical protein
VANDKSGDEGDKVAKARGGARLSRAMIPTLIIKPNIASSLLPHLLQIMIHQ